MHAASPRRDLHAPGRYARGSCATTDEESALELKEVSRELLAQAKRLQSLKGELDELRANVASLIDGLN